MSDSMWPHGLQHARLLCPSPPPRVCPSSYSLNQWRYLTISSPAALFSFCLQSFQTSESALRIRWARYWSFGFSISPSNEYSGLISFKIDWFDLSAIQDTKLRGKKSIFFYSQHFCPDSSVGKESTCNEGDLSLMSGLGRSPGEGKGYPLQYSGLENSMDCIGHGVAKSWTWLSTFTFTTLLSTNVCFFVFVFVFLCTPINSAALQIAMGYRTLYNSVLTWTAWHYCIPYKLRGQPYKSAHTSNVNHKSQNITCTSDQVAINQGLPSSPFGFDNLLEKWLTKPRKLLYFLLSIYHEDVP